MASFPFKHVLMVGATSGIGNAMANRLVKEGVKVTAVGRRQDRLDAFVSEYGHDKASSETFDIADTQGIPSFVKRCALIPMSCRYPLAKVVSADNTHQSHDCPPLHRWCLPQCGRPEQIRLLQARDCGSRGIPERDRCQFYEFRRAFAWLSAIPVGQAVDGLDLVRSPRSTHFCTSNKQYLQHYLALSSHPGRPSYSLLSLQSRPQLFRTLLAPTAPKHQRQSH